MHNSRIRLQRAPKLITNQNLFDFIHFRCVVQGITNWPYVLSEAYRCLKPGGYVELSETSSKLGEIFMSSLSWTFSDVLLAYMGSDDGSMSEENPLVRWSKLMKEAMIASGRVAPSEELLRERLEQAGYVDVQSFTLKQPFGPWAKDRYETWPGIVKPPMLTAMSKKGT
jgi:ubiquinone/menaquinone biosynthesis C-methylase UbiE